MSFTLIGGDDAQLFDSSGGTITFAEAPDFERPRDSNRDNIYNVRVRADDGRGGLAALNLRISVINDKEGIAVTRIANGFIEPVALGYVPTLAPTGLIPGGKISVAQANGEVFEVDGTTGQRVLLTDFFDGRPRGRILDLGFFVRGDSGLSGIFVIAQEPTGRVFFTRLLGGEGTTENELLPDGSPEISAQLFDGPELQNGAPSFYAVLSDEAGTFSQDPISPRGKLILLEPESPYSRASISDGAFNPIVIGTGLRSSGGAGAINGQILLSDRGNALQHELTFFPPDARPLDFGWPGREGALGIGDNPPAPVNGPTIVYDVGTGMDEGQGVVFGGLYKGPASELNNSFIFGDISGAIWSIPFEILTNGFLLSPTEMERRTADFEPDQGQIESPTSFVIDDRNRMFLIDADGELFRIDGS